ncbi:glycosyltransferase [Paenibacillus sp. GD4]|nr:glycosyltransferase [Paenibacillus sp. GD4]MDQ1911635.1 glycosyltransferase [Paenibacillus sp. GD4]
MSKIVKNIDADHIIVHSLRKDTPVNFVQDFTKNTQFIKLIMKRNISLPLDILNIYYLRKIIKTVQPDLLHLHSSKAGILGRIASINLRVKTIYTPHGFSFLRKDISKMKRFFYFFIEKTAAQLIRTTYFLCVSKEEYNQAVKLNRKKTRVKLIFNSVDTGQVIDRSETCVNPYQIVTIGRLTAAKNPFEILSIINDLVKTYPQLNFVWIGDGDLRIEFEAKAKSLGLPVTITGWLPKDKVNQILRASFIFIQASLWEGLPFSLLEAMLEKKPVVVSNIPGHRDVIVHTVNGFIAKDTVEFCNFISDILLNHEKAQLIGSEAYKTVINKFSDDIFVKNLLKFYHYLL